MGGGPAAVCDGQRCAYPEYDPTSPIPLARPASHTIDWFYALGLPSPVSASTTNVTAVLLRVPAAVADVGFDLLVTSYALGSLCMPGSAGGANASGLRAGPLPFGDFRGAPEFVAVDNFTWSTAAAAGVAVVNRGMCAACRNGTIAQKHGASACTACAAGQFQPGGVNSTRTACMECPAGSYQPAAGAGACTACPTASPLTVLSGASVSTACYTASLVVERVWLVGRQLAVTLSWDLAPAAYAGIADIIALIFTTEVGREPQRQLAWAYTSAAGQVEPGPQMLH